MKLTEMVNQLFPKSKEEFATAKAPNGETYEAESFEPGNAVFLLTSEGDRVPLGEGEYELEDGSMIQVDAEGVIAEFRPAASGEEEAKKEEKAPEAEAMSEEKPEFVTKEELDSFKAEIMAGFETISEHMKSQKTTEVNLSAQEKVELENLRKKTNIAEPLGKDIEKVAHKVKSIERNPERTFKSTIQERIKSNNEKFINN